MAERIPAVLMPAALGGRKYKAAVFNRTAANENMPVRLAGLFRERRGDRQHGRAGFSERAVKCRESQVIANSQTEPAPREVSQHSQLARSVIARLAIAFSARKVDVEHMDLVVPCEDVAPRIDQEGAVGGAVGRDPNRKRTNMNVDAEGARELAQRCQ